MPLSYISFNRVNIKGILTEAELIEIRNDVKIKTIQFCDVVEDDSWEQLEEQLFSHRDDISLRVYSLPEIHLSFLRKVPSLTELYVDCVKGVTGYEYLRCLPKLKRLHISDEELVSFEFLNCVTVGLETLGLGKLNQRSQA